MGTWRGPAFLVPAPGASGASTRTTPARGASVTLSGEVRAVPVGEGERPLGLEGWLEVNQETLKKPWGEAKKTTQTKYLQQTQKM